MEIGVRSKEREYAYPREWYAAVIARATAGELDRASVASSYAATFHPLAMPAKGHAYRLPDGSIEHDGTYVRLPRAERYEDRDWGAFRRAGDGRTEERIPCSGLETREELEPLIGRGGGWTLHLDDQIRPAYLTRPGPPVGPHRATIMLSLDAGGGFVRDRDGRIVRDRREVARILAGWPDLQRFALALLAEPAARGRKRRRPETIARGLLFANLQPAFGTRPTARRLLTWEDELGAPWRIPDADLAARFDAGGELSAEERHTLRRAEDSMIRSCRRAGIEPSRPPGLSPPRGA
jgi:hypothetical protein